MKYLVIFIFLPLFSFAENFNHNEIREIVPIDEIQEKIFLQNKIIQNEAIQNEEIIFDENNTNIENTKDRTNIIENETMSTIYTDNETTENTEIKSENKKILILKQDTSISDSKKTAEDLKETKQENLRNDKFEEISSRTNRVTALGSAMGAIDLGNTPTKKIRLGAGVGNSSSSQAVAVGVGYAPTERFKVNTKFSTSTNNIFNNSISVGASYDLDI